ncbi:caspase family protein [Oscillatoria sp. CS-180]|uniref:DEAD/DEAH box helicase n=1 Tax=Oscillatoria sp. CS-180 TaxID=3021720 RepID=UPI002330C3E1|nr:DEAD/DEAH box helicase [Oscillatoria sp. CS-180]MDB9529671.1 caspase family protein [Oscillatoria sp. CS-180]
MVLKAVFIGINKHSDPRVNELSAATKDAIALWALFKDSVQGISDKRLLDDEATARGIRQALDESLGDAGKEDTVIVFFAGHGTPRHQLVPHDVDLDQIDQTTIDMQELTDRLRSTRARATVVILDCCFSGGAPARVLAEVPVSRGVVSHIEDLGGAGRVVLAAARDDQEALELGQHGLFTAAMLRVLQESPNWTDIGVMMDEVIRQVRAEASRTGHEQIPVWAGMIEGGIELPPLQKGPIYMGAFPDTTGIRIGSSVSDLSAFLVPDSILKAWQNRFSELNNLQLSAVNDYRVMDGKSLLVVAPTTSGKTFIGELAAARAIADHRKAVFLFPFKALTNEKFEEFEELYGKGLGLRVIRCTGDYADQTEPFAKGQYDIALLTYEMFLGLSVSMPELLTKIGLVVLDEAQFVTDSTRGITVELLLTNLLTARERGIEPQIVVLSAVIGDVNHFNEWLGCQTLITDKRPVPLVEGVMDRSGVYQFIDVNGQEQSEQMLQPLEIIQRKAKPGSQDVIVPLVKKLVAKQEQILIFRNNRGAARGCASYLANDLGLQAANTAREALPGQDLSTTSQALRSALSGGTAFHTSDLSREERLVVEQTFRSQKGGICVMAATSTVAAGINTPAETVIIVETSFPGSNPKDYSVAEYKNMAGRAGRLGFSEQGKSILVTDNSTQRKLLFNKYVCGQPEPFLSSFKQQEIDTWILRLLAQVREVPKDDVVTLLSNTYAGYLETRNSPSWEPQMRTHLGALLSRMIDLGLVEEEMGVVRLSLLGQACGRSNLKLQSAMRLVEILQNWQKEALTAKKLLAIIHALSEFDDSYTPLFKRGKKESVWPNYAAQIYGSEVVRALRFGARDTMAYYARCKRVAVLQKWIGGSPISEIENIFTMNPYCNVGAGDIRSFADFARFHLVAASEIAEILLLGQGPDPDDVEKLLMQLEVGIPASVLVPHGRNGVTL